MASRPWISPAQVRSYTDIEAVAQRTDDKLRIDIARAEQYVVNYTRNDFSDVKYASGIPEAVSLAVLILSEAYARQAVEQAKQSSAFMKTGMKSETFDDYSYSVGDSVSAMDEAALNLPSLLDDFVLAQSKGNVNMRLRKL